MSAATGATGAPPIRAYEEADLADLRRVCLLTGDAGGDATGLHASDELLADVFAEPYVHHAPGFASVVERGGRVEGYVIAAPDAGRFVAWWREHWLPGFALRHPLAEANETDAGMIRYGLDPERLVGHDLESFPAHLHIDLLPSLQGAGTGRLLIRRLLGQLRDHGVPGVQLGVSERNVRARDFYAHLGFRPLPSTPGDGFTLGIATDARV